MQNEKALAQGIKQGECSPDELVARYYQDVYRFCCRRCGDPNMALDLTQETFLKVVRSMSRYTHQDKLRNWVFTIAVNVCNDYFRGKYAAGQIAELNEETPQPGDFTKKVLLAELVKKALDTLPEMQKTAVILRFYHDMKIADIAKVTGVSLPTAKSRLHQATDKLKLLLREEKRP